ncbi:MAG: hypothetical protein WC608_05575 [Parcubacteria group bacterium]
MKKIIGWLIAIVVFVPIFLIIVTIGVVKKLRVEEVTMQELVVKYFIDVVLVIGVIAVCAVVCFLLEKRRRRLQQGQKRPAFGGQVVQLTFASEMKEKVLELVEQMEAPLIARRNLETPWAVFESTRAFFARLKDRWKS